jgi:hypothetical protein
MKNQKKEKKNRISPLTMKDGVDIPDYTPDIYQSEGQIDQIMDSLSMEFGRNSAKEMISRW